MNDWTLVHLKNLVFHEVKWLQQLVPWLGHDFISKNWKSAWIWNKAANKQQHTLGQNQKFCIQFILGSFNGAFF